MRWDSQIFDTSIFARIPSQIHVIPFLWREQFKQQLYEIFPHSQRRGNIEL